MKGGKGFAPAVTRRRVYPAGACVARGTPSAVFTTRSGGLRSDDLLGWDKKWTSLLDLRKAYRQDVPLVLSEERSLFLFFFWGGRFLQKNSCNYNLRQKWGKKDYNRQIMVPGFTPQNNHPPRWWQRWRQEDAELTANQRLRRFLQAQVKGGFSKGDPPGN